MTLRRIAPLTLAPGERAKVSGPRPELRWVPPTELMVDETYQRDLSRKSLQLIEGLTKGFAWNRMKPPIVVKVARGFHIVDGQHTAIAAATLGLPEIPIFVVTAETLDERARAFVGHNTDRIVVSPMNIHRALLAAGDPDALDVDAVCRRAGVRLRQINQGTAVAEGDTMSVGSIRSLIKRHGVRKARAVLCVLVKGRRAPIGAAEIKAVEQIVCVDRMGVDQEALAMAVRVEGDKGFAAARARSAKERTPLWREVMARYLRRIDG